MSKRNDVRNDVTVRARELRAGGLSYRKIADALAEEGFVTRTGKPHNPATIRTMLAEGSK